MRCSLCSGHLELLGSLGCVKHYRCRSCGMLFTRRVKK